MRVVKGQLAKHRIVDGANAASFPIGHAYPALVLPLSCPERLVNGEREVGAAGTWLARAKSIAHLPACEMPYATTLPLQDAMCL